MIQVFRGILFLEPSPVCSRPPQIKARAPVKHCAPEKQVRNAAAMLAA
jgi:hypothetical protein